jgi:hypothetical protein
MGKIQPGRVLFGALLVFLWVGGGTALASYVVSSNADIGPNTISGHNPPAGKHANVIAGSIEAADLAPHSVTATQLDANSVTGAKVQNGALSALDLAAPARLPGGCSSNQIAKWTGAAWACADQSSSGGTVTSVGSGTGLTGGPITGSGTLSLDPGYRLPQGCSNNQYPRWGGGVGWHCDVAGSVTSVAPGIGLNTATGGAITDSGQMSIATPYRLPQGCTDGQVVRWGGGVGWGCGSAGPPSGAAGGDLTGSYPAPTIGSSAVTGPKVAAESLTGSDIQDGSISPVTDMDVTPAARAYDPRGGGAFCNAQDISNTTWTPVTFTQEDFDNSNMHTSKSDTSGVCGVAQQATLTAPSTGLYQVSAGISWDDTSANLTGDRQIAIEQIVGDGSGQVFDPLKFLAQDETYVPSGRPAGTHTRQNISTLASLTEGDSVRVEVRHDTCRPQPPPCSPTSLALAPTSDHASFLAMSYVGPLGP